MRTESIPLILAAGIFALACLLTPALAQQIELPPPTPPSPIYPDGQGGAVVRGSLSVGGSDLFNIDLDGDGTADLIFGLEVPVAADSVGTAGTIVVADDYIYYCVASGTWVRTALVTWP